MQFLIVSYIPIELVRETTADSFPGDSDTHENLRTAGGRRTREAGGKGGEEGQGGQSWEQGHARLCAGRGLNVMRQRSHDPQRQGSRLGAHGGGGGGTEDASPGRRCERQERREINTSSQGWSKA